MEILIGNQRYPKRILTKGAIVISEETIGGRVKQLRESHGMSQEELGDILGMNKSAVEGIESGRNSNIRADIIKLLCETFHEYPGFLLFGYGHDYWRRLFGPEAEAALNTADGHGGNNILTIVKKSVQETLGSEGLSLLNSIRELNDTGQSRAKLLINDLLKIEEYQRGT